MYSNVWKTDSWEKPKAKTKDGKIKMVYNQMFQKQAVEKGQKQKL